jgi:hypothetical protein
MIVLTVLLLDSCFAPPKEELPPEIVSGEFGDVTWQFDTCLFLL